MRRCCSAEEVVLVTGFKESFLGGALLCACDVGDKLRNDFEKDGTVWKDGEDGLSCSL